MDLAQALSLIGELTPYYRQQMTALPTQQRRVVCALARGGALPMSSSLIARESRMEPRAAATALTRLKAKGIVTHADCKWNLADAWLGAWYRARRGDTTAIPVQTPPVQPSLPDALLMATGTLQQLNSQTTPPTVVNNTTLIAYPTQAPYPSILVQERGFRYSDSGVDGA